MRNTALAKLESARGYAHTSFDGHKFGFKQILPADHRIEMITPWIDVLSVKGKQIDAIVPCQLKNIH